MRTLFVIDVLAFHGSHMMLPRLMAEFQERFVAPHAMINLFKAGAVDILRRYRMEGGAEHFDLETLYDAIDDQRAQITAGCCGRVVVVDSQTGTLYLESRDELRQIGNLFEIFDGGQKDLFYKDLTYRASVVMCSGAPIVVSRVIRNTMNISMDEARGFVKDRQAMEMTTPQMVEFVLELLAFCGKQNLHITQGHLSPVSWMAPRDLINTLIVNDVSLRLGHVAFSS